MWVTVEPLCCTLETNIRLYINNTSIKKKKHMAIPALKEDKPPYLGELTSTGHSVWYTHKFYSDTERHSLHGN